MIDTVESLKRLCAALAGEPAIFLDTEFMREGRYYPELCCVQIAGAKRAEIIDAQRIDDLRPLGKLLQNPNIVKVLHASHQDIEAFWHAVQVPCVNVFDTQIAATFLGAHKVPSYASLVDQICHVELHKDQTLTDWSLRPLSVEQINYALDDVRYLPAIYQKQVEELVAKGRLTWVQEESDKVARNASTPQDPWLAYRRVRSVGTLKGYQLKILREVAAWREMQAIEKNLPRRTVLADDILIAIARSAPRTIDQLLQLRGMRSNLKLSDARELFDCVQRGKRASDDGLLMMHEAEGSGVHKNQLAVIDLMMVLLQELGNEHGIAPLSLATKKELEALFVEHEGIAQSTARGQVDPDCLISPLMSGWRRQIIGENMVDLLEGKIGCRVVRGKIKLIRS